MKPAAGTSYGCIIWILAFTFVSLCLCPMAIVAGALASTVGSARVIGFVEPYLCPENSTAEIITYQTTMTDDSGSVSPATGYVMQCVDAAGTVVRAPNSDYAFYIVGVLVLVSLVLSVLAAFFVAAPLGAYFRRRDRSAQNGVL